MASKEKTALTRGALVRDTQLNRVGEFMALDEGEYYLRPQGGGLEWTADPGDVEVIPPLEALSLKVAEANRRSENGRGAA